MFLPRDPHFGRPPLDFLVLSLSSSIAIMHVPHRVDHGALVGAKLPGDTDNNISTNTPSGVTIGAAGDPQVNPPRLLIAGIQLIYLIMLITCILWTQLIYVVVLSNSS